MANLQHPLDIASPELRQFGRHRDLEERVSTLERKGGSGGGPGSTGPTGPPGPPGLVHRGAWNAATAYTQNDAVTYEGSYFRRKVYGTTPTDPATDTTNWELLASKGDDGADGAPGPTLPVNDLSTTTGNLDMEGFKVIDHGTPTSATDVANKQYVDAQAATKPSIWSVTLEELDAAEWSTDGWTTPLSGLDGDLIPGLILIPIFDHLPYGVADLTVHERPTFYGATSAAPVGVEWGTIWTGSDVSLYIQANPASIQTSDTLYEIVVIGKSA